MQPLARLWRIARYFVHPAFGTARLFLCAIIGITATWLAPSAQPWRIRALVGWDVSVLILLSVDWVRILSADADTTERRASSEDLGRLLVWLIAIGAALFSLFAAIGVLRRALDFGPVVREVWTALALLGVALAWVITHTAYALRYAHLHYADEHRGGFSFTGEEPPTETDFAYLSFTIGISFATSDVSATSSVTRRAVLAHAIVSFVHNITILALAIELGFKWLNR